MGYSPAPMITGSPRLSESLMGLVDPAKFDTELRSLREDETHPHSLAGGAYQHCIEYCRAGSHGARALWLAPRAARRD
jgi:hypothetical protein